MGVNGLWVMDWSWCLSWTCFCFFYHSVHLNVTLKKSITKRKKFIEEEWIFGRVCGSMKQTTNVVIVTRIGTMRFFIPVSLSLPLSLFYLLIFSHVFTLSYINIMACSPDIGRKFSIYATTEIQDQSYFHFWISRVSFFSIWDFLIHPASVTYLYLIV